MKNILIITQKIDKNDDVLGFFNAWVSEFSKHFNKVLVVCLEKREYDLPNNVRIFSLGKENGHSRIKYLKNFYKYIFGLRKEYDVVFVHMNPIYVVLGGFFWKIWGKKILLWYTHKSVDLKLQIAKKFSDHIFTATKESFRLSSKKLHILGHGIETEKFICERAINVPPAKILHMGRITKIKNLDILVEAFAILKQDLPNLKLIFAGATITPIDKEYMGDIKDLIGKRGLVSDITFKEVSYDGIAGEFCQADLTVNLTPTGGLDKAVLSGLISKRPTFTSNEAFRDILGEYSERFIFKYRDPHDLASKIKAFIASKDQDLAMNYLSEKVRKDFSVETLVAKIIKYAGR